jgi:hypothetical protein
LFDSGFTPSSLGGEGWDEGITHSNWLFSYFSGFSFLSNSSRSNMLIFNLTILLLLLIQYLCNQSSACPETANQIISFSHFNNSSKLNSGTSTSSNLSTNSSELSNNHI